MECKNHPTIQASYTCSACGQPFCDECLVDIGGRKYCSNCKMSAVQTMQGHPNWQPPTIPEEATIPCKEANEALIYSIVGLFCCGIIIEPLAIYKAQQARKMLELNPRLEGSGKATAALVISIIGLSLWGLGMILRILSLLFSAPAPHY
jgi:hypothetical protein